MPPKPTKGNAPAASTAEASGTRKPSTNERTENMHSIAQPHVTPALSFSFEDQQLRVVMIDAEPWFVVADVCAVLGIKNPSDAIKSLDEDEIRLFKDRNTLAFPEGNRAQRGNPTFNLTSESGFYTLILRCRDAVKPGTTPHRVRRWVTGEVIPSIRKTGGYSVKLMVPRDRQIGRCQALMRDIERSESKVCRDGLIVLAGTAFADLGLDLPDMNGLRPLQMPLLPQGGAS